MGCYNDNSSDRDVFILAGKDFTVKECFDHAKAGGYTVAALQNGNECYTSLSYGTYG